MTIPREEIVKEFVLAADDSRVERVFTVTEAADVAERLVSRAIEIDRDPAAGTVLEERHHWYIYDRMGSFLTGVMAGIFYFGCSLALSIFIPDLIAIVICLVGLVVFIKYYENKIIKDNRDL